MLIQPCLVLDAVGVGCEGLAHTQLRPSDPTRSTTTMIDPGALGTLTIGLEAVRLDNEANDNPRRATRPAVSRRQRRAVFVAVAGWLRLVADRLDRPADRTGFATR
jgi:hypothetical protein